MNIAEILKNCSTGMELDCAMYEDVYFDYVDELNIIHCYIQRETCKTSITFNQYGTPNSDVKSKCVIFPKGKTTWEGFQSLFKEGDIVVSYLDNIHILKNSTTSYCFCNRIGALNENLTTNIVVIRLATEAEKQKLFDSIKANGYKWNDITKTLEKLVPRFKVGDTIKNKNDKWQAKRTIKSYVAGIGYYTTINDWVRIENQDEWELVIKPIFKKGDKVRVKNGVSEPRIIDGVFDTFYSLQLLGKIDFTDQDNWELVPNNFDINTLIPFESKVLVRNAPNQIWIPAFWGFKRDDGYATTFGWCQYCIPYKGNEHLFKTADDCSEFFKTWK